MARSPRSRRIPLPALPDGPLKDLYVALLDLHDRAGWPSMRLLASKLPVSHPTVHKLLACLTLAVPERPLTLAVAKRMAEVADLDVAVEVAKIANLWGIANTAERQSGTAPRPEEAGPPILVGLNAVRDWDTATVVSTSRSPSTGAPPAAESGDPPPARRHLYAHRPDGDGHPDGRAAGTTGTRRFTTPGQTAEEVPRYSGGS